MLAPNFPAMAALPSSLSAALFCLLLVSCSVYIARGDASWATVQVSSLLPSSSCSDTKARSHGYVQVVHRHGPCSSNGARKADHFQDLARDALRVSTLQAAVAGDPPANDSTQFGSNIAISARSGVPLGSGNYVITAGFGTPLVSQTVAFDTGSNLNWIQCQPCAVSCYPQVEPVFNPALSSTYTNVSCADSRCVGLNSKGCMENNCLYAVNYGDGSSTVGFLAADTLTLTPTDVFSDFMFGCGQKNLGLFKGTAGLIGLGRSPYSLNSQGAGRMGNIFSYCLPSTSSTTGYLNIGNPLSPSVEYTQVQDDSRAPSLYFIDLIGITVGGRQLPLLPTVFQSVGTIIDSGTVITRLPPMAYTALRTTFRDAMAKYPLVAPVSLLDTCYDFSQTPTVMYPVIKLQYTGAEVTLPATGAFFAFSPTQVCLAFAGNADDAQVGIIGNVQQKTFEVIYDNVANKVGFAPGACS